VNDLREVKRWVMAWGADCWVVEPLELRESIVDEVNRMLRGDAGQRPDRASIGLRGAKARGRRRRTK
jgi:hypothetical protein